MSNFMSKNIFDNTNLYSDVNSEVQKDITAHVNAPALTWHMAFLIGRDVRPTLEETLDALALRLIHGLKTRGLLRETDPVWPSYGDEMILLKSISKFEADGSLVWIPPIFHTKRAARLLNAEERSFIVFWRWPSDVYGTKRVAIKVKVFQNIFTITVTAESAAASEVALDGDAFAKQTIDVWSAYSQFLFDLDPAIAEAFAGPVFKPVFADIRGIVLKREDANGALAEDGAPTWAATALTERLRRALTHGDDYECTASYMLDGKALFASSLGAQPLDYPDDRRMPMTFLMWVQGGHVDPEDNVGEKQLGRVLERLHLIEMLRQAALLDLDLLREASQSLATIDRATQEARTFVETFGQKGSIDTNQVGRARIALNGVANAFLDEPNKPSKKNIAGVGLTFRIESSRYYVSQMKSHLPALRFSRVEGYRTYKQFVQRKLGATFEFIDRLGIRYERATTVMSRIEQSLATAQASKTGQDLKSLGLTIAEIQSYGELVLLCILVPYYIFGAFHYLEEQREPSLRGLGLTLILVLSFYATGRFFRDDPKQTRVLVSVGLFVGWLVALALAYRWLEIPTRFINMSVALIAFAIFVRLCLGAFRGAATSSHDSVTPTDNQTRIRVVLLSGLAIVTSLLALARHAGIL